MDASYSARPTPSTSTLTEMGWIAPRAPVTHVSTVAVTETTEQGTPLSATLTAEALPAGKPVPLSVSVVPPSAVPKAGEMPVTSGVVLTE
jgi:hypothetical protein